MKKRLMSILLALILGLSLGITAYAAEELIYDEADLLERSEERELEERLQELGEAYDVQIVIITTEETEGSIDYYVEELYDSLDLGVGPERDGVLLLVDMDYREYRILSNGYAGVAIDPGAIEDIGDAMTGDLSDGSYADAFLTFAEGCAYYLDGYVNGYPFAFGKNLGIALVIGLAAGLITVLVLRGQLKSVRKEDRAHSYVIPGSMRVSVSRDMYLYRNVSRRRREKSNSSSGGSSRSVGGGSF